MSLFRKITYYVPLFPRPGIVYHLTTHDVKLLEDTKNIPGAKKLRRELQDFQCKSIIPDDDLYHYAAGFFFRGSFYLGLIEQPAPFILASGLCFFLNEPFSNASELAVLRHNLQELIECRDREAKKKNS